MRILTVGDVCGTGGCETVLSLLPKIKKELGIDLVIVNGENSADSNGISKNTAGLLLNAGADVITGGNHTLHRKDFRPLLDENGRLLRPHNMPKAEYGTGYCLVDMGYTSVAVINLLGQVYLDMHEAENPFLAADRLIEKAKSDGAKIIFVDFHAEATSEKKALGFYLDGKVSALFGTHTHVQTNDACVLSGGTGYITDLGMTGPDNSVLGIKPEIIIDRFKNCAKGKFEMADGPCSLQGAVFEIDVATGLCVSVQTVNIKSEN